ncbi:hypothetical protein [Aeoliella mucimassa]|uniref:Uncharacterized protein n=1 Tax=Aeoliella mucimassa TaxID=2527972 RepID=A0A518ALF5_9BACT|nr:hypothetical protein [Aeoliella mucimassa]QDU55557.1 hypothetical protein Pan181_17490 [Aeoliella mucimassa]
MKSCDLQSGAGRIRRALEHLELTWAEVSSEWNDEVSRAFAEQHLEPMLPVVKTALDAVGRMDLMLREAQRDLER